MLKERNRFTYFILALVVIILGLGSRYLSDYLPNSVNLYLGDTLWALMIFLYLDFCLIEEILLDYYYISFIFPLN